jgi:prepilin-type N-terminal cleavage/methylation domain-containing protein
MKNLTCSHTKRRGFTLVEMLVVLVIMSILMGIGATVMKSATTAQGVGTAVPLAEGVFNEARTLAKSSGLHTRVVIYQGGGKGELREKHLRYFGIVKQAVDGNNEPVVSGSGDPDYGVNPRLVGRGATLPTKTFFNAKLSSNRADGGSIPVMTVMIPGETSPQSCYYFEFNSEGILNGNSSLSESNESGPVVQAGRLNPGSDIPKELTSDSRESGGFAIWKRGNMSRYRSVNQIPSLGKTGMPKF